MDDAFGRATYRRVRGALIAQGSTFSDWCRANHIERKYAERCLTGQRDGPRAREIRRQLLLAAGMADAA